MKKRIAIWMHGGLGSETNPQGQPCVQRLISKLAIRYAVDVYVHVAPAAGFSPQGFVVHTPPKRIRWGILRWISLLARFATQHRKLNYDLLYAVWGYPAGILAVIIGKFFGLPSVIHLQGGDAAYVPSINYGVFCHPIRRRLCVWAYSRCSLLIALTEFQRAFLVRFGVTRAVQVVPYGVDTTLFEYKPSAHQTALIRCLHVGNQTPVKDQDTLLNAFAILSARVPAALTLVGEDYNNGRVRRLCSELQIEDRVVFLGPQPYADLPNYYHESDVLIHTSLYEGQGMVFTEAAASGTLLAGTKVGVLADMGDECGIITQTADPLALADEIVKIMNSPSQREAKRIAARKWATEKDDAYTLTHITKEVDRLLVRRGKNKTSSRAVKGQINSLINRLLPAKLAFRRINKMRKRQHMESLSGPGSSIGETVMVVDIVSSVIRRHGIRKILDVPCGDFNWMTKVNMDGVLYHGADILDELILTNAVKYGSGSREFSVINLLKDELPMADLIVCRDCLVHFSYRHIRRALKNIKKSGATYLLTTTFPNSINSNITTGDWFMLDLEAPPFSFPEPIERHNEGYNDPGNEAGSKSLALWRIEDLPIDMMGKE